MILELPPVLPPCLMTGTLILKNDVLPPKECVTTASARRVCVRCSCMLMRRDPDPDLVFSRARGRWRGHFLRLRGSWDENMAVSMSQSDVQMHRKEDGDEDEQRASRSDRWKKYCAETLFIYTNNRGLYISGYLPTCWLKLTGTSVSNNSHASFRRISLQYICTCKCS